MIEAHHITKLRFIADMTTISIGYCMELLESKHLFSEDQASLTVDLNNQISRFAYTIVKLIKSNGEERERLAAANPEEPYP
jgi:hypothetical protein